MQKILTDQIIDLKNYLNLNSFYPGKTHLEFSNNKSKYKISYDVEIFDTIYEVLTFSELEKLDITTIFSIVRKGSKKPRFTLKNLLDEKFDFNLLGEETEISIRYENRYKNETIYIKKSKTDTGSITSINNLSRTIHIVEYDAEKFTSITHYIGSREILIARAINKGMVKESIKYYYNDSEINYNLYNRFLNSVFSELDLELIFPFDWFNFFEFA